MRLLDLFSGAGGAAVGYHQAGFDDIVGVDIVPQPNYPFTFIQADAFNPPVDLEGFDLIHASPPCQAYSTLRHSPENKDYPDLIEPTLKMLRFGGVSFVVENVPGAPMSSARKLCGSSFALFDDGYELRRHRLFESSFYWLAPQCFHRFPVLGVYGDLSKNSRPSTRGVKAGIEQAQELMEIDWMTPKELVQAIPPAYTKFIGEQFVAQVAA